MKFLKDKTKTVSCNVDQNYRMWNSKSVHMFHDMKTPILRIDYYQDEKITYSEFWNGNHLISLLADKLYHFGVD